MSVLDLCRRVPIEKATKPRNGVLEVYVDFWWSVVDEHILLFRGYAPQCNEHQNLAEKLTERLYPGAETRQLPVVYLTHECDR